MADDEAGVEDASDSVDDIKAERNSLEVVDDVVPEQKQDLGLLYREALQEEEEQEQENRLFQAKLCAHFKESQFQVPEEFLKKICTDDLEGKYLELLGQINEKLKAMQHLKERTEREFFELEERCDNTEKEINFLNNQFNNLIRNVAGRARYSTNGNRIPIAEIDKYFKRLDQVNKIKRDNHLEYIKQRNALRQIKKQKKETDSLKCEMNIHDYEVMVYETNVLNIKIEQRKKEIEILRKKCWDSENAMSHLKQKLHVVKKNKHEVETKEKEMNHEMANIAEDMRMMKIEHQSVKKEKDKLQQFLMVENKSLLDDYFVKKQRCQELTEEFEYLKKRHQEVTLKLAKRK